MKEEIAEMLLPLYGAGLQDYRNHPNLPSTKVSVVANQIISLLKAEIEKVENPYPHFHGESLVYGSSSEAFEQCRQAILKALES